VSAWLDVLSDAGPVHGVYGDDVPPLTGVVLHEISLHRDGPRATLRFDLPVFPSQPPRKWAAQGFNTAQVQLMLVGINELRLHGWDTNIRGDLSITREGEMIRTRLATSTVEFDIGADAALISAISAYRNGSV
jgi:hypothetical protein